MDEICTYQIEVRNGVDEKALNATSPLQVRALLVQADATLLTAHADQSGLVGLVRHLHRQGYVLLSVLRR